ncbi:hypothetical protein N644_1765 [Lactiplantibacillus paraplantarum]|nr:hypothetical protein N644_1765 [Lactiplantibacillus paraplantarum]
MLDGSQQLSRTKKLVSDHDASKTKKLVTSHQLWQNHM